MSVRPKLAPQVLVVPEDDENGFLETARRVSRLHGSDVPAVAMTLLPALTGEHTESELAELVGPAMSATEVAATLGELRRQGLLIEEPQAVRRAVGTVAVIGPDELVAPVITTLRAADVVIGDVEDADLVLVGTAALLDPEAAVLITRLVAERRAHLCFGLDTEGTAFVGPLWSPDRVGPCFDCLRTRLHANSGQGQVRLAYQKHLAATGGRAVLHHVTPPLAAHLAGWVSMRVLRRFTEPGRDRGTDALLVDGETLNATDHVVLPVPTCTACGAHQRSIEVVPEATLAAAQDAKVGIVHLASVRQTDSAPRIYLSGTTSADSSMIRPTMRAVNNGGGGFTRQVAIDSALGEALERYAAGVYHATDLRLATWREMGPSAVHPGVFSWFSPEQYASQDFPFAPFTEDTPVRWAAATRWRDGERVWVPASQVYLPYRRKSGETLVAQCISSGMAAGPDLHSAVLSGLYEVIERDALAVSWMHRLPPRPVTEHVIAASTELSHHLKSNVQVSFYDLSLDLSPSSVVAVMRQGNVIGFGSSCRENPVRAAEKAFLEAAQGLTYIRRLVPKYADWSPGEDFGEVNDFNHHAILYTKYPELRERVGYLVDSVEPAQWRPACDLPVEDSGLPAAVQLGLLCDELAAAGHDVLVVDLTTPDVALLGVRVVRVLVPGLVHLAGTHRCRQLGVPRLRDVVRKLGVDSAPDNPFPHPLP